MEISAHLRGVRLSPKDARLVANELRGQSALKALNNLSFPGNKAEIIVKKVLESAIANARYNYSLEVDNLKILRIYVNQGTTLKRMHARAKGRGSRILKPTCHITVTVSENGGVV